ncbi:acetyl-CoA acetyltransferase [Mycobacterium sp. CBMA 234]|uniref:thiolase family protein n=1 Tax=Mycolicibacterium sp. CBMA 234 TaxID=1918495 RepID=UPI0012DD2C67|nr:thiolase family protein [Mycolicibacterium sp. CBMA 234]MUL65870.1 acetyl-CoA acetyltransferase [Mycolicibacterium sp. CBMA 234]
MSTAVIVDAIRSPLAKGKAAKDGRPGGALSTLHPVDLLGQVLRELVDRNGIDSATVDDVITGCVSQAGEQSGGVGRFAWLSAGLDETVPSVVINRACGSSQQAADFAAQGVIAGVYDIVIAAGVESMSRVPMGSARIGQDPFGPVVAERYAPGLVPQGVSAELVAARWKLDRETLDEYSARSHARAAATDFSGEIVPITVPGGVVVDKDETIRPSTTAEGLAGLKPVFETPENSARFPEINWSVTAGNSSQLTDGASAVLIMSEEKAAALGLRPRARFHSFALAADDPISMLTGPIPATEKLLRRSGIKLSDIDHYEVNEAFASVPLAWQSHFDADPAKLNPRGGAIALGHPLGCSGARLLTTMLHGLEASGGRYGLQTMCEAGGMANATLIERL